jgi:hypothetical protein
MSIKKYIATADTTITNAYKPDSLNRAIYANMGASDSLEIFSVYISGSESQKARILINFPIETIKEERQSNKLPQSGSVNFILNLKNVEHPETLPTKYYVSVRPVSSSWEEGYGLDLENYSDAGQKDNVGYGVNWIYRSTNDSPNTWLNEGGDYINSYEKSFYFDTGLEDITLDITQIIEAQISEQIPPNGISITLSGSYENGTLEKSFYTKRFSARSSEYFYNRPSLEARWESVIKDDRTNMYIASPRLSTEDNTKKLFLYNKVNSTLKDLPNSVIPNVVIKNDLNSTVITSLTASKESTGIYSCEVVLTGLSENTYYDVWYSGSTAYYTGSFDAKLLPSSETLEGKEYIVNITNLKQSYTSGSVENFKLFIREKDWSPNIYKIVSKEVENITLNNLYYKVFRILDNYTIIDYGIEPIKYTLCSYNKDGNYFDLTMDIFEPGYMYGIKFMIVDGDNKTELPQLFKFRVG